MGTKTRIVGLNLGKIKQTLMDNAIEVQTERLVAYAQSEMMKLGNRINSYVGAHHMDRTGHLLNSLCWGVTYNGTMKASGFYRDEELHSRGIEVGRQSYLHEFFNNDKEEVEGRRLAEDFLRSYQGSGNGWDVFWAVLAPYWGYWEGGFNMKSGGNTVYKKKPSRTRAIPFSSRRMQFSAMIHTYYEARMDLKPAKTKITVYRPKYSYTNPTYKNRRGYKRIGILR